MPEGLTFALTALLVFWGQVPLRGYPSALSRVPSTFLHELSHYLVASLTGSRPSAIDLVPRRTEGGWQLGAVQFYPGPLSAAFVALAPLGLLGLAGWLFMGASEGSMADQAVCGALFSTALQGAFPSRVDWALAAKFPISLVLLGLLGSAMFAMVNPTWPW